MLTERRTHASKSQEELTREAAREAGYQMIKSPLTLADPSVQMNAGTYANAARKLEASRSPSRLRPEAALRER